MLKNKIREIIYKNDLLFRIYYKYVYKPKNELEKFLDNFSQNNIDNLFFIQVGANDGMINDPFFKFIRRDNWKGLLIEPQSIIFERLRDNYSKFKEVTLENVAISNREEIKKIFRISFSNSRRASGVSSFIKDELIRVLDAGYAELIAKEENINLPINEEEWITTENVKCTSFNALIAKHKITKVDLLAIDTEGYDYEIIKTIPFNTIKPLVIIYEHTHFNEFVKTECSNFLSNLGYTLKVTTSDTIAELE
ncbi:MAG: FkbM family methyltransferase [Ignavibacteriales bacterium]|nr:FkbM family methyltransferase [Ignavibacteriales bacterium]